MTGSRDRGTVLGLAGWKVYLPGVLLWVLFASLAAHSAVLEDTYIISPGYADLPHITGGNIGNFGPYYYGLNVLAGSDVYLTVENFDAVPNSRPHVVTYALESDTGAPIIPPTVDGLAQLLLAGMNYVLKIECSTCSSVKTNITASAVPLPAAAWLFGSALVGFIMMANRRSV